MRATQPRELTEEAYFALEATSEERHEWHRGEIQAMAGGSANHNRIARNLLVELATALRGQPCEAFMSDLRLHIRAHALYTYPDVMVICGAVQFVPGREDTVTNPTLIAEVLSASTEAYDRGKKWERYQTLGSLQAYLLIAQDRVSVSHFERRDDGLWLLRTLTSLDETLHLPVLGVELPTAQLYQGVEWNVEG